MDRPTDPSSIPTPSAEPLHRVYSIKQRKLEHILGTERKSDSSSVRFSILDCSDTSTSRYTLTLHKYGGGVRYHTSLSHHFFTLH